MHFFLEACQDSCSVLRSSGSNKAACCEFLLSPYCSFIHTSICSGMRITDY